jgi:hypothetical protein
VKCRGQQKALARLQAARSQRKESIVSSTPHFLSKIAWNATSYEVLRIPAATIGSIRSGELWSFAVILSAKRNGPFVGCLFLASHISLAVQIVV